MLLEIKCTEKLCDVIAKIEPNYQALIKEIPMKNGTFGIVRKKEFCRANAP